MVLSLQVAVIGRRQRRLPASFVQVSSGQRWANTRTWRIGRFGLCFWWQQVHYEEMLSCEYREDCRQETAAYHTAKRLRSGTLEVSSEPL